MAPQPDLIQTSPMLHHYDVSIIDETTYLFHTDRGAEYVLSFVYIGGGDIPMYAFNIDRRCERESNGDDNLIRNTVVYVLQLFFEEEQNAILSTCDADEISSAARYRLFKRWFRQMDDGTIAIRDEKISTGSVETWAMMFYRKDSMLAALYNEYMDDYISLMDEI